MQKVEELDEIASELFRVFSRVEYSLKASGFNNGDGDAAPHWRNFASSVEGVFENPPTAEFEEAIKYILKNPPNKQIIDGGHICWREATPNTDSKADKALIYVRRVRNNLFHGGKFNVSWFHPDRSKPLLLHSLVILRGCINASPKVRRVYEG